MRVKRQNSQTKDGNIVAEEVAGNAWICPDAVTPTSKSDTQSSLRNGAGEEARMLRFVH
jgi:hypothetical protein